MNQQLQIHKFVLQTIDYQDLAKLKARKVGKTVRVMKRTVSVITERGREIYLKASSQKADLWIERFGFLGGKFLRVKRKITADNYCTAIKWNPNAALMLWPFGQNRLWVGVINYIELPSLCKLTKNNMDIN